MEMGKVGKNKKLTSLALSIELIKNNTTYTRADGVQQCFNYMESTNSPSGAFLGDTHTITPSLS
jgi:hypothetical protein